MRQLLAGQRCIERAQPQNDVVFVVPFGIDLSTAAFAEKSMFARRGLVAAEIARALQDEIFNWDGRDTRKSRTVSFATGNAVAVDHLPDI